MKNKSMYILGGVLLLAFAGFSLASFRTSLTPYVSFSEAQHLHRVVQVAGGLQKGSTTYNEGQGALVFRLVDPKTHETMQVRYHGVRPANFEDAISIVAIGRYNPQAKELEAQKLLVKCPSKYQGAAAARTYGS